MTMTAQLGDHALLLLHLNLCDAGAFGFDARRGGPFGEHLAYQPHCDTVDGPIVTDARKALDTGNVNMVLGWVQEKDEAETRDALQKSASVRKTGATGKEADRYFFETLVRVHRAGEGAAYTGLKPAGEIEPAGAYVEYVHYVEGLYNSAGPAKSEHAGHAATAAAKPTGHQHGRGSQSSH